MEKIVHPDPDIELRLRALDYAVNLPNTSCAALLCDAEDIYQWLREKEEARNERHPS